MLWLFAQAPGYHASERPVDLSEGDRSESSGPDHAALARFFRHTGTPVLRSWQPSKEGAGLPRRSRTSVAQLTEDQVATDAIITYVSPTRNSQFDLRAHRRLLRSRLRRTGWELPEANATDEGGEGGTLVRVDDITWRDGNGRCWDDNGDEKPCDSHSVRGGEPAQPAQPGCAPASATTATSCARRATEAGAKSPAPSTASLL